MNDAQLLVGNGTLITRDPARPFIEHGAVLITGSTIEAVGTDQDLKALYPNVRYVDAQGRLIMPGYINAHHHIYSAFARGMNIPGNHPKDFLEILEGTWWKLDRHLSLDATYYSAVSTFIECIQNGVTTVVDHHASYGAVAGSLGKIGAAADLLGIRSCLAYEISDRDGKTLTEEAIGESFDFASATTCRHDHMQKALIGMHASFTLSDNTLELCKENNNYNMGYHIHVAEGAYDNEHALATYGCSAVERLVKQGILGPGSIAGHCIHVSDSDMDLLKANGVTVVHNPQSNMGNAVGCPDVLTMKDKGIRVCLGTDGYTNDMLESAKTAIILQKHNSKNPDRGFMEVVDMLFYENAALASSVFGIPVGILKEGAAADVIVVDYTGYTPLNESNYNGHLLFGVSGRQTDTTIINGKILMEHKKLLLEDAETYYKNSRNSAEALWRTLYE